MRPTELSKVGSRVIGACKLPIIHPNNDRDGFIYFEINQKSSKPKIPLCEIRMLFSFEKPSNQKLADPAT